ncbi:methyl-accepting chemotaxis protein [Rhizobium sp. NFR03]|uniref:methyl-accepting chemotaxis protein n=1 Tax=Rhizobium sp. NFR03 TaxID=1566263 RepID=UPI0008D8C2D8|nr:methyl-accepting chemotaxis protein [Rhizobium sp. NFR03]SER53573.1 methyl-accepting chemotaxis protein [Rhizobium sp. NFR03]
MHHETRQKSLTVSQRLATLGVVTFVGISAILATGWYEHRQIERVLAEASVAKTAENRAIQLRVASLNLVLAAMDTIVDKDARVIAPDRMKEIDAAASTLTSASGEIAALAAGIGEPNLGDGVPQMISELTRSIQTDLKALVEAGADEAAFDAADDRIDAAGSQLTERFNSLADTSMTLMRMRVEEANAISRSAFVWQFVCGLGAMVFVLGLLTVQGNILRRGILGVRDSMQRIHGGDYATPVGAVERSDEIGDMARCVDRFRTDAIDKQRLERDAADSRSLNDTDRRQREMTAADDARQVQVAVSALGQALNKLADGQLTVAIDTPFRADLESLRLDFNQAVEKLRNVLSGMRDNSASITANGRQMRSAADDLAKRTEQQAASLEETSAALDQITVTVRTATEKAEEASQMVSRTHANAEESGRIVGEAVAAMARIEDASAEIGKIINVIDEIAFQTNLLALNAGVEAARAGEAGKGFAVVAQEVRELAQRAAGAAKDIKGLVNRSSTEVGTGVRLVQETGDALGRIGTDVEQINEHMRTIVVAAREQSTGLTEINIAIGQLDQMTQQNAAMVEQTNASSHTLAQDAESLSSLIAQFAIGGDAASYASASSTSRSTRTATSSSSYRPAAPTKTSSAKSPVAIRPATIKPAAANSRPAPSPAKALMGKLSGAFASPSASSSNDQWEEF